MFSLVATQNAVDEVVDIARSIWIEHYPPIVGIKQVEYMLDNMHSREVITDEIANKSYHYFLIKTKKESIGYIGLQIRHEHLFLSKLYISSSERGKGLGKSAMNFIRAFAQKNSLNKIFLTVNKHNTGSIAAYYKFGFLKTGEICVDIGGGFKMDDYQMELVIEPVPDDRPC